MYRYILQYIGNDQWVVVDTFWGRVPSQVYSREDAKALCTWLNQREAERQEGT